jgi:hypothetical protein
MMVQEGRKTKGSVAGWTNALARCPHCHRELTGHSYSLLAAQVVERDAQRGLLEFFESLKAHDWLKLLSFQRWEGGSDNVELYGILCDFAWVVLVVVRSPLELFEHDEILGIEVLEEADSKALLDAAKGKSWKLFE